MSSISTLAANEIGASVNENIAAIINEGAEFSPCAWTMITLTLLSAVLFLGSIGAWLWWGAHQFQNCL